MFNEALTFDINRETLSQCRIEFSVLHDSLLGPSESLGRAFVSPDSEKHFFNEMLTSKTATAQWLSLTDPDWRKLIKNYDTSLNIPVININTEN